jgi:hypothetical protein
MQMIIRREIILSIVFIPVSFPPDLLLDIPQKKKSRSFPRDFFYCPPVFPDVPFFPRLFRRRGI